MPPPVAYRRLRTEEEHQEQRLSSEADPSVLPTPTNAEIIEAQKLIHDINKATNETHPFRDKRGCVLLGSVVFVLCVAIGIVHAVRLNDVVRPKNMVVYGTSNSFILGVNLLTGESVGFIDIQAFAPPGTMLSAVSTNKSGTVFAGAPGVLLAIDLACLKNYPGFVTTQYERRHATLRPTGETTMFLNDTNSSDSVKTVVFETNYAHVGLESGQVQIVNSERQVVSPGYTINTSLVGSPVFSFLDGLSNKDDCGSSAKPVTTVSHFSDPTENGTIVPHAMAIDRETVHFGGSIQGKNGKYRTFVGWSAISSNGTYKVLVKPKVSCGGSQEGEEDPIIAVSIPAAFPNRLLAASRKCAFLFDNHTLKLHDSLAFSTPIATGDAASPSNSIWAVEKADNGGLVHITLAPGGDKLLLAVFEQELDATRPHAVAVADQLIVLAGVKQNRDGKSGNAVQLVPLSKLKSK